MEEQSVNFKIIFVVLGLSLLVISGCTASSESRPTPSGSDQACHVAVKTQSPIARPLFQVVEDGSIYITDGSNKQVLHYSDQGKLLQPVSLPADYKPGDIPAFAVWNNVLLFVTDGGLLSVDKSGAATLKYDLLGKSVGLGSCTMDAFRYIEVTPTGTALVCASGVRPSRTILKYSLGHDNEWSILYGGETPNEYGMSWQSMIAGWDGYTYIQNGNSIKKMDESAVITNTIVITDQSVKGTLVGVDRKGYLYLEKNLDPQMPMLYKVDPTGNLVWSKPRPFINETIPLIVGVIDADGNYYYWQTNRKSDEPNQLMRCTY